MRQVLAEIRARLTRRACASCGHPRDAHEHYRAGTERGACGHPVLAALTGGPYAANVPMLAAGTLRAFHELPMPGVIEPEVRAVAWIFRLVPVPLISLIQNLWW